MSLIVATFQLGICHPNPLNQFPSPSQIELHGFDNNYGTKHMFVLLTKLCMYVAGCTAMYVEDNLLVKTKELFSYFQYLFISYRE